MMLFVSPTCSHTEILKEARWAWRGQVTLRTPEGSVKRME